MSFAIFDPLFALLSEEIDVPVAKLKKAWDNCLVKFFKTDPNVQAKIAPKLQQAKKPTIVQDETNQEVTETPKKSQPKEEPSTKAKKSNPSEAVKETKSKTTSKSEPVKLPNCDESGCTIKVKLSRPIDGKNYCSKHYQKHSKALSKKETNPEESTSKKTSAEPLVPSVLASRSDSESEEEAETEEVVSEDDDLQEEQLESEEEDNESPDGILRTLKEGFDTYFKQPVTAQNLTRVGTMEQYLVFFRNNWHDFQKVYDQLVDADELQALIQKKKVQKADLFMLFEKVNPKLMTV